MIKYELKIKEQDNSTFNMAVAALRIVFMGSQEFSVASLDALLKSKYNIAEVVTAPDTPPTAIIKAGLMYILVM